MKPQAFIEVEIGDFLVGKVAYSKSVAVSTVKASAFTKPALSAGAIASAITPLAGFAILVDGMILMTKMAGSYATQK
jgi:hypothetical protein